MPCQLNISYNFLKGPKKKINFPEINSYCDLGVILHQIGTIFRSSLAQIRSKIAKFERISTFSDLHHGNTSTGRVSSQNDTNL